jgi:tetratricopeptide (TPR) repeat protein
VVGPTHPQVVNEYNNLAVVMVEGGQPEVAEQALARSKELAAGLPPDRQVANIPGIEGMIWEARGDCVRAVPLYETGIEHVTAAYGPKSASTANGRFYLGRCLAKLGRRAEALPHLEFAVEQRRAARGDVAGLGAALFELAQALAPSPAQRPRAFALADEALSTFRSNGSDSEEAAQAVERWLAGQRGAAGGNG